MESSSHLGLLLLLNFGQFFFGIASSRTLKVSLTHVGELLQINFGKDIIYERNQPVTFQPASEFLPMIDEVYKALIEKTKSIPGSMVENNRLCVSVHFRCVDEKNWTILAEQVRSVLKEYPKLRLSQGRKVLEVRPIIKWDKGKALEFLLESLGFANQNNVLPLYIGEDRTDEDAFKVVPHITDASNFSIAPGVKIVFKNNVGFPTTLCSARMKSQPVLTLERSRWARMITLTDPVRSTKSHWMPRALTVSTVQLTRELVWLVK